LISFYSFDQRSHVIYFIWQVVKGNGPCNKQRLDARKKAWENGEWVREAAAAHAKKRAERQKEKAA